MVSKALKILFYTESLAIQSLARQFSITNSESLGENVTHNVSKSVFRQMASAGVSVNANHHVFLRDTYFLVFRLIKSF